MRRPNTYIYITSLLHPRSVNRLNDENSAFAAAESVKAENDFLDCI